MGADASKRESWERPYSHTDLFHEPFVLFGYLAAFTETIQMTTGILILPQRQTALVAKQAAAVDVLTGGRLRLVFGIGWNDVEYEALGEKFANRGRRSEEQIELMRLLWTQEVVNYDGRYHKVTHAGINPLPVQRPIPIWFGGGAPKVVDRIGRLGDGWFPQFQHRSSCDCRRNHGNLVIRKETSWRGRSYQNHRADLRGKAAEGSRLLLLGQLQ